MIRVLITGSRTWSNRFILEGAINHVIFEHGIPLVIVHGGAKGADQMAGEIARQAARFGVIEEVHHAAWETHGKAAGVLRNQMMVDLGADICLAFIRDGSSGASDCARRAAAAGIPVRTFIERSS